MQKPERSMSYRIRARPRVDPMTGITYARQLREVLTEYLLELSDDGKPRGAFDLKTWAEENDSTCDPRSGGMANTTSMAAAGGVSVFTLVNSVFPRIAHCLHREGPVANSTVNTIVPACHDYTAEQRAKQSGAGKRNATSLIRWAMLTDGFVRLTPIRLNL